LATTGFVKPICLVSAKSAIVVPAGVVNVSDEDVLLAIRAPAGTVSAIELPAQLASSATPATSAVFQAAFGQVLPAATQV
jgi:hypothetical protein